LRKNPRPASAERRIGAYSEWSMPSDFRTAGTPLIEAVKVGDARGLPGEVTYTIVEPRPKNGDKRVEGRHRTRLRSGKVLDLTNKFLIDCQVHNRSRHGARLILAAKLKAPRRFRLFSDTDGEVVDAKVIWQRGQNVGVTFLEEMPPALTNAQIAALRKQLYVV
jgi:hypothetical protein